MYTRRFHVNHKTKNVGPPKTNSFSMKEYVSALLGDLYISMATFKNQIEALDRKSSTAVPTELQKIVSSFCRVTLDFADSYKVTPGRVRKAAVNSVEKLHEELRAFENRYSAFKQGTKISNESNAVINELIESVHWFVCQYHMTVTSFPVTHRVPVGGTQQEWEFFIKAEKSTLFGKGVNKVLSHRPKDWELREIFRALTTSHQTIYGKDKFIQFKRFSKALENLNAAKKTNLKCSERTYRNLKRCWESGEFDNVI